MATPALALQILFLALKLTKTISWSWWAVLIPTWIYLVIVVIHAVAKVREEERREKLRR